MPEDSWKILVFGEKSAGKAKEGCQLNFDYFVLVKSWNFLAAMIASRVAQNPGLLNHVIIWVVNVAVKPGGNVVFFNQVVQAVAIGQLFQLVERLLPT